jgi:hypothetical protein
MGVIVNLGMATTMGLFNKVPAGKSQRKWSQKQ